MHVTGALAPPAVRYIKLGPGGAWVDHALRHHLLELGHSANISCTGDDCGPTCAH